MVPCRSVFFLGISEENLAKLCEHAQIPPDHRFVNNSCCLNLHIVYLFVKPKIHVVSFQPYRVLSFSSKSLESYACWKHFAFI